ncbi:MAG TPA: hypothetical protein VKC60_14915 [Opitutaceae bacterium]|nr:hypothetical protein [Opitutaceae bacterium]
MSKKLLLAFWCAGSLGLFPGVATGSPGTRDRSSPEFTFDVDLNVVLNADQIQTDSVYVVRQGATLWSGRRKLGKVYNRWEVGWRLA